MNIIGIVCKQINAVFLQKIFANVFFRAIINPFALYHHRIVVCGVYVGFFIPGTRSWTACWYSRWARNQRSWKQFANCWIYSFIWGLFHWRGSFCFCWFANKAINKVLWNQESIFAHQAAMPVCPIFISASEQAPTCHGLRFHLPFSLLLIRQ